MIVWAIVGVLLTLGALEYLSLRRAGGRVQSSVETDLPLCAPGEEITLRYTITNTSPLPLLYVGFSLYFDDSVTIREPEDWQAAHVIRDISGLHMEQRLRLRPHSRFTGRLRFSVGQRGLHPIGKRYLETGDYLGLRATVRSVEPDERVICTADLDESVPALKPLGGVLGDHSVLRFLHEDPCLVAGYREYTGREPMKQISWTQTAKIGQWMVKQQDHTAEADVTVLLNMDAGQGPAAERALATARSVCEWLEERKIPYSFRSNGDLRPTEKGLGRGHLFPILRGLGLSRLACYTGFDELAARCAADESPDRTYVVITASPQEAALRRLQSASDHRLVVLGEGPGEDR